MILTNLEVRSTKACEVWWVIFFPWFRHTRLTKEKRVYPPQGSQRFVKIRLSLLQGPCVEDSRNKKENKIPLLLLFKHSFWLPFVCQHAKYIIHFFSDESSSLLRLFIVRQLGQEKGINLIWSWSTREQSIRMENMVQVTTNKWMQSDSSQIQNWSAKHKYLLGKKVNYCNNKIEPILSLLLWRHIH